jgi:hypothetical protein
VCTRCVCQHVRVRAWRVSPWTGAGSSLAASVRVVDRVGAARAGMLHRVRTEFVGGVA